MKHNHHFYSMLESVQYGVLYLFAAFFGGVSLDFSFPHYDPKKPIDIILREAILQSILLVLIVIVIRFFVKKVPILFPTPFNYIPHRVPEFNGEMMMGFIFLGCQINLIQKIDFLATKLYNYLFYKDRKIKNKGGIYSRFKEEP
jgi:hypothetical protein